MKAKHWNDNTSTMKWPKQEITEELWEIWLNGKTTNGNNWNFRIAEQKIHETQLSQNDEGEDVQVGTQKRYG